jgi:hypothetical protein
MEIVNDASPMTLGELIQHIVKHARLRASNDTASRFVQELLKSGILVLSLGVTTQDVDWDLPLLDALKGSADPLAIAVSASFERLREIMVHVGGDDPDLERAGLLESSRVVSDLFERFDIEERPSLGAFRVDASADAMATLSSGPDFTALERDMTRYVEYTLPIAWPRIAQANMRHFFDSYYGGSDAPVALLTFYEDYYRNHYKQHQANLTAAVQARDTSALQRIENPFGLSFVSAVLAARNAMLACVSRELSLAHGGGEVNVALGHLRDCTKTLPPSSFARSSVGFIGSVFNARGNDGGLRFIGRNLLYSLGHGHMFSRWLHMLPSDLTDDIRRANARFEGEEVTLAEIAHDSFHNANFHPDLVERVLAYPGSELASTTRSISLTDLIVVRDAVDDLGLRLEMRNSGKRVVPLDLGFVNFDLRPPLFRLLAEFGPPSTFQLPIPATANATHFPADAVTFRPRIVLGRLVASRAQWTAPLALVPRRERCQSDFEYFRRINQWREEHDVPRQVFVRLLDGFPVMDEAERDDVAGKGATGQPESTPKRAARARVNDRKPQFLDFESPLVVKLLARLAAQADDGHLAFLERYPDSSMLTAVDGRRRTTEAVLQIEVRTSRRDVSQLSASV